MANTNSKESSRSIRLWGGLLLICLLLPALASTASATEIDDAQVDQAKDEEPIEIIGEEERFRTSPEMVEYDRLVGEAMIEADRLTAEALRKNHRADPVLPRLPEVPDQLKGEILTKFPGQRVTPPPFEEPSSRTDRSQSLNRSLQTNGNGYQTDTAWFNQNLPNQVYAFDYFMWMGTPQSNEANRCDGVNGSGTGCFWFQAAQYNMDYPGAGFHTGPQRGASFFGDSEDDWHLNHSGYNAPGSALPVGDVCTTPASQYCVDDDEIPMGTWVRIRVWRTSTTYDNHTPGGWSSNWGAWAQWGGVDHHIGANLSMRGRWIVYTSLFVEIYEATNQCNTDFDQTYFHNPRSLSSGQGWTNVPGANAIYETNCDWTSWHRMGGPFVRNKRQVQRTIFQNWWLW